MKRRYLPQSGVPRADFLHPEEWHAHVPHLDVFEPAEMFVPTGILGPDGQMMFGYVGPEPLGFLTFKDEDQSDG